MKRSALLSLSLLLPALLSGCVIKIGADVEDDHAHPQSGEERRNREVIAGLPLGLGLDEVRRRLGEPAFSEAMSVGSQEVRVLRYRTHRLHSDGDTTPDETTPLVFRNGQLSGFGDAAVAKALAE